MANDEMRTEWSAGGVNWVDNEAIFDALFAPVTEAILDAADIGAGQRVLDVGCGSGTLLAAGVASGASMTGIDISPPMVEAARRRAPWATVVAEDAQTADLAALSGAPFDRVVSRFGVMFFADPVAAFGNLRAATDPDGQLVFSCWRGLEENAMFTVGLDVLVGRLGRTPSQGAPGTPGPLAFADPDWLAGLLADAGWTGVDIVPFDFTSDYGFRGTDGVEERLAIVLGNSAGRAARAELEPRLGPDGWAALLDEVRTAIRAAKGDRAALSTPAAAWLVTAHHG